ncbi:MAG TPA: dipeptide/oligopeptide/nickel ABC transporter permease/ATP-binding protein, partial [Acetobacteraceae bacterium]|nr:dipeptide/oligopeptide/nickel ABC transporter permease/ATP-binding protein [Acetobacteraceae bacterium]
MLALLLVLVIVGPEIWGAAAMKTRIMRSGEGPSADFLLGTDRLGRDLLARTITASRLSLTLALASTAIAGTIGVSLGIAIAFAGARLRALGLRLIEVLLGFPGILLAIFITAIIGPSIEGAVVAIGIAFSPEFARLASTLALSVGGRDYVAAARVLGVDRLRLLRRHVLPNIAETLTISVFSTTGAALIAVSSLSFLGLGVQPPRFDWGRMLVEGVESFYETPVAALAPAVMIAATGLALGFFGEALARAMNPLLWSPDAATAPLDVLASHARPAPTVTDAVTTATAPLLEVAGLTVSYPAPHGEVTAVDEIDFSVADGEIVGIVGESGSGKTQTALAIARLVSYPGRVTARRLTFAGRDLLSADTRALDRFLGSRLALVFQDPMSSLNPALSIGTQVAEPATVHQGMRRAAALRRAADRLGEVHIPRPENRLTQYPHEFSGGMQQRVMIAMGLMNNPALIIADEPTTALDVTIQAQILQLLARLRTERRLALLLITHDLQIVRRYAD